MRRAAAVPGYDSFYFFFNETDGENSAVDPIFSAPPGLAGGDGRLPHPMTSILRTGVGQFGAGVRLASGALSLYRTLLPPDQLSLASANSCRIC
jgi:hypothetical protein